MCLGGGGGCGSDGTLEDRASGTGWAGDWDVNAEGKRPWTVYLLTDYALTVTCLLTDSALHVSSCNKCGTHC